MINNQIFFFFYNFAHQSFWFDKLIFFCAETLPYFVVLLAGLFLVFHHDLIFRKNSNLALIQKWKEVAFVFFSGALAWFSAALLKLFVHTPRPFIKFSEVLPLFDKSGYAFPSGHAAFFIAIAFALFFNHKKLGCLFMFFALIISIARIASGVHFPIDILGGFILGILVAYLVKFLYKKIK
jgi:membrane-associated phospholipid phosphatase